MNERQAVKFWSELRGSSNVQDVIRKYQDKKGYAGTRTLERYTQADKGFREGLSDAEVVDKTDWSEARIVKIRGWWETKYTSKSPDRPSAASGSIWNALEKHNVGLVGRAIETYKAVLSVRAMGVGTSSVFVPDPDCGPEEMAIINMIRKLDARFPPLEVAYDEATSKGDRKAALDAAEEIAAGLDELLAGR